MTEDCYQARPWPAYHVPPGPVATAARARLADEETTK